MDKQPVTRQSAFRVAITLALVLVLLMGADTVLNHLPTTSSPQAAGVQLTDVSAIDDLHARFTSSEGKPRLILFVSPT
jgi:hypothetical protein